jgi:EAL domain-containing protein (putative c-di-GMP-specific phosphodiesterase class I)
MIDDIKIYIDYSIGISETKRFRDCKALIPFRDTDQLAGFAKENNLPYVIFNHVLLTKKYEFNLLGLFLNALKNNETFLLYQPVIDAHTKELVCLEALIRWDNPEYGLVMPNDFIPLVESTQLIHPMTEWVIRQAIREHQALISQGLHNDVCMSINLSAKNINNPEFYDDALKIIKEEKADPSSLVFEITESVLLAEKKHVIESIKKFVNTGIRFAIDDFGKGYSSITYLSQFKTDFLKIDRSYIQLINDKDTIKQIIIATVKLAHQFGLKVVAEGVETKDMYEEVMGIDVDSIQGYHIARPMKAEDIINWYKDFKAKDEK